MAPSAPELKDYEREPNAGGLFRVRPGFRGVPPRLAFQDVAALAKAALLPSEGTPPRPPGMTDLLSTCPVSPGQSPLWGPLKLGAGTSEVRGARLTVIRTKSTYFAISQPGFDGSST
jgi:hypothetical protein